MSINKHLLVNVNILNSGRKGDRRTSDFHPKNATSVSLWPSNSSVLHNSGAVFNLQVLGSVLLRYETVFP
jgi:hypothetical protein